MDINITFNTLVFAIFVGLWLSNVITTFRLDYCIKSASRNEANLHILEEELNAINNEQDLIYEWINSNDVIIAGLNDDNQKRKQGLPVSN